MHYAIEVVPFGEYADPRNVMRLAQTAESAGWGGLFIWDHLGFVSGFPAGDPWVILSAVAATTSRLRLGTDVTPVPRRRPQVLAQTLVTLDLLSQGRVIFGAGLGGVPAEFSAFGEQDDARLRAAKLDEALDVLDRWMSGETVTHHGANYCFDGLALTPLPVQRPRIPIWIGGESRPALRRAARWDGSVIPGDDIECKMVKSPQDLADLVGVIRQHRTNLSPFDIAITGCSASNQKAMVSEYSSAGATWWLETLFEGRGPLEELLARLKAGPPN